MRYKAINFFLVVIYRPPRAQKKKRKKERKKGKNTNLASSGIREPGTKFITSIVPPLFRTAESSFLSETSLEFRTGSSPNERIGRIVESKENSRLCFLVLLERGMTSLSR